MSSSNPTCECGFICNWGSCRCDSIKALDSEWTPSPSWRLGWGGVEGSHGVGMEVVIGGCVYCPGGHQGGGAAGREGRAGVPSLLGASGRAGLLAPAFQTSGLQDAQRPGFSVVSPSVLCFVVDSGRLMWGRPCPEDRGSDLRSAPAPAGRAHLLPLPPLPGQHPPPRAGPTFSLCSLSTQDPLLSSLFSECSGPQANRKQRARRSSVSSILPQTAAQPSRPPGEQDAGPGMAETHGLYQGLLQTP